MLRRLIFLLFVSLMLFFVGFYYSYNSENRYGENRDYIDISSDWRDGGDYVRVVFLGSYSCNFSNNSDVHHMVNYTDKKIDKIADERGLDYYSTGISLGMNSDRGVSYLGEVGDFNEIVAGAGSYNFGAHYLQNELDASRITPQIWILRSEYEIILSENREVDEIRRNEEILRHDAGTYGLRELYEWFKDSSEHHVATELGLSD